MKTPEEPNALKEKEKNVNEINATQITEKELEQVSGAGHKDQGYYEGPISEFVCPGAMCLDCVLYVCIHLMTVGDDSSSKFWCTCTGSYFKR